MAFGMRHTCNLTLQSCVSSLTSSYETLAYNLTSLSLDVLISKMRGWEGNVYSETYLRI